MATIVDIGPLSISITSLRLKRCISEYSLWAGLKHVVVSIVAAFIVIHSVCQYSGTLL